MFYRDVVYNISVGAFTEVHSIKWSSKESVVKECLMKGKPKVEINNNNNNKICRRNINLCLM